jgi:dTDP-4-amino-4,6-dideoxygalactose transaminase
MTWRRLPPAGNPVSLRVDEGPLPAFPGHAGHWVQSGTAALALALCVARARSPAVAGPEVILPAYGCPDLVAAAVFARLRPVLVDVGPEDPGYDLAALRAATGPRTVAVVAVNFLGISERLQPLREIFPPSGPVLLVQDDAQCFPHSPEDLHGDVVTVSFGRGKPVSLLGGGAAWIRCDLAASVQTTIAALIQGESPPQWLLPLRLLAYNAMLNPVIYGAVSRLPMLGLGSTVYSPLAAIAPMGRGTLRRVASNVNRHAHGGNRVRGDISAMLDPATDLPRRLAPRCGRLLRYPVLCRSQEERDHRLARLVALGVGATALYRRPLRQIEGIGSLAGAPGGDHGAAVLAGRMLTLPLHAGVTARDVGLMARVFAAD